MTILDCANAVVNAAEGANDAFTHIMGDIPYTIDFSEVFTITTNSVAIACPVTYEFTVLD
jgi:hypothetical protein